MFQSWITGLKVLEVCPNCHDLRREIDKLPSARRVSYLTDKDEIMEGKLKEIRDGMREKIESCEQCGGTGIIETEIGFESFMLQILNWLRREGAFDNE